MISFENFAHLVCSLTLLLYPNRETGTSAIKAFIMMDAYFRIKSVMHMRQSNVHMSKPSRGGGCMYKLKIKVDCVYKNQ